MLPYAETLMPRWKKLMGGSLPAPFHFSNFEESVLDRSDVVATAAWNPSLSECDPRGLRRMAITRLSSTFSNILDVEKSLQEIRYRRVKIFKVSGLAHGFRSNTDKLRAGNKL